MSYYNNMNEVVNQNAVNLTNTTMQKEIDKIIQNLYNLNPDFNFEYVVSEGSRKGDNYMGLIYRIVTSIEINKALPNRCSVICKMEPEHQARREQLRTKIIFDKEKFVYNELLPEYKRFQEEKMIPQEMRFSHIPTCLGTGEGYLILSDMCEQGFQMRSDDSKEMDFQHAKFAFETLGRFHSISYAMKYQNPGLLRKFVPLLEDRYFGEPINKGLYDYIKVMFRHAAETLDENDEARSKMMKLSDDLDKIVPRMMTSVDSEPYAVITHGDFWRNNIMYKYRKGLPIKACLLDYQMCRYASPALDLAYFIFCCTDKQFRQVYYHQILHIYHQSLSQVLGKFGINVSLVLPYHQLEKQMKKFGLYGVIMASLIVKSESLDEDEAFDLDQVAEVLNKNGDIRKLLKCSTKSWMRFKDRMISIIQDADGLGMLDFQNFYTV